MEPYYTNQGLEIDPSAALTVDPFTEMEEIWEKLSYRLANLIPPDGELLGAVYDYDPGLYEDAWPALTVFPTGAGRVAGTDELPQPNIQGFTVRTWYPIYYDNPEFDPMRVAELRSRRALSKWLRAIWDNDRLSRPDDPFGYEVEIVMTPTLTSMGLPGFGGDDVDLRGWEAAVEVKTH